jgi:dihydrodipicolinate synthase/N-acetylneuraminate lyase
MTKVFAGVMPALMTPCKPDRTPDFRALTRKGRELIEAGMSAVVYCGSMGDWPLLTDEQRMEASSISSTRASRSSSERARRIRSGRPPSPATPRKSAPRAS